MPDLNHSNVRLSMSDYNLYFSLLEDAKKFADRHNIKFSKEFEFQYFKEFVYHTYVKDVAHPRLYVLKIYILTCSTTGKESLFGLNHWFISVFNKIDKMTIRNKKR